MPGVHDRPLARVDIEHHADGTISDAPAGVLTVGSVTDVHEEDVTVIRAVRGTAVS